MKEQRTNPRNPEVPYGYCGCGCGKKTNRAKKTVTARGQTRGEPYSYVVGHNGALPFAQLYSLDPATGCWDWLRMKCSAGYGRLHLRDGTNRIVMAHRFSYETHIGAIPENLELDHLCRNRACVNPEHLEPVSREENIRRGVEARKKGRQEE